MIGCPPGTPDTPIPSLTFLGVALLACSDGTTDSDSTTAVETGTGDTGETLDVPLVPAVSVRGEAPVNLLVISIDTLRRDRIGAFSGRDTTPFLDGLMADGVVLEDHAPCANWTYPSVLCTQVGMDSLEIGVHPAVGSSEDLHDYTYATAEALLAEAGYRSALTSANPYFQPIMGTGRHFDAFAKNAQWAAGAAFGTALEQIQDLGASGDPWYQHVHIFDPHTPYNAPVAYNSDTVAGLAESDFDLTTYAGIDEMHDAWDTMGSLERSRTLEWLHELYDAEVRYTDDQIRLFMEQVESLGLLEGTLVLFWSDHGEQFTEHGGLGHGLTLFSEEMDGLGFFWMADEGLEPLVFQRPTAQRDLLPTVWDLLGLPAEPQFTGDVIGTAPAERGRLGAHWSNNTGGILSWQVGTKKLVYHWTGELNLYDRSTDPTETTDIADERPERVQALWAGLQSSVALMEAIHPEPSPVAPTL